MTVSTVIAGLLPIMWSTSVGAEVMKPLATPVLGGMVSSLLHVLIVTPVIFLSIRERQLGLQREVVPMVKQGRMRPRTVIAVAVVVVALIGAVITWRLARSGAPEAGTSDSGTVVHTERSGSVDVVVLSPTGMLRTGRNNFTIEFRSPGGGLVDVGTVRVAANMTMPGMAMSGNVQVQPSGVPGRYTATAEFGMAGAWPVSIEWEGPAGRGSATFEGAVQ